MLLVGAPPDGADQLVEHLHAEVGQRSLALDGEGHGGCEPAVRAEAQQFARRQHAGFPGQDGVTVRMDGAPLILTEADAAQC